MAPWLFRRLLIIEPALRRVCEDKLDYGIMVGYFWSFWEWVHGLQGTKDNQGFLFWWSKVFGGS